MEFSIKLHIIKLGWSILYIEGSHVIFSKKYGISSLKIDFVLAKSADPDERLLLAAFHLGLHCSQKYPLWGFRSKMGLEMSKEQLNSEQQMKSKNKTDLSSRSLCSNLSLHKHNNMYISTCINNITIYITTGAITVNVLKFQIIFFSFCFQTKVCFLG